MLKSNALRTFIAIVLLSGFLSCGRNPGSSLEEHCGKRDKVETVVLTSFEECLPDIHSGSSLYMMGDTLIIQDNKSTDMQFFAYDVREDKYLGNFGKFGEGPGEIANFGAVVTDPENKMLYGMSYNRFEMYGFNVDEALSDPDYGCFFKIKLKEINESTPLVVFGDMINDSTAYYEVRLPDADWINLESRIGIVNLNSGGIKLIEEDGGHSNPKSRNILASSRKKNLIVWASSTYDRVCIFDFDGKLRKIIYGPDYKERREKLNREYFYHLCIGKDGIYAGYLNELIVDQLYPDKIIVMDHSGNYVKTIDVGMQITGMAYNENFNRLYLSTTDYPQFGYIQL